MGVAAWAMVTSGVERIMVGTTSHEVISMLARGLWRDMCARVPMGHGLRRMWDGRVMTRAGVVEECMRHAEEVGVWLSRLLVRGVLANGGAGGACASGA